MSAVSPRQFGAAFLINSLFTICKIQNFVFQSKQLAFRPLFFDYWWPQWSAPGLHFGSFIFLTVNPSRFLFWVHKAKTVCEEPQGHVWNQVWIWQAVWQCFDRLCFLTNLKPILITSPLKRLFMLLSAHKQTIVKHIHELMFPSLPSPTSNCWKML